MQTGTESTDNLILQVTHHEVMYILLTDVCFCDVCVFFFLNCHNVQKCVQILSYLILSCIALQVNISWIYTCTNSSLNINIY